MQNEPYPGLESILEAMGQAGRRLVEIDACEGAAGNISVCLGWRVDPGYLFPDANPLVLPQPAPSLAGATILVSGSGRRLREIKDDPLGNVACVQIETDGKNGRVYTSPKRRFEKVTSEFNSHLAVHADQIQRGGSNFHALVHAQPVNLTFISHIPRFQDEAYLNQHLLRWQPETIINLPEGIGFIPFRIPGSPELMAANIEKLRQNRLVIWAKHGVMARSDQSVKKAVDVIEYAETAAKYEQLNLSTGEPGEGLSAAEIRSVCERFNIQQNIF